jgi:hypothetical protein
MIGPRNIKIGQVETRGNRRKVLNGYQVTTTTQTEGVAHCRETIEGRRRRADAGVYIKAPHHALTAITENADTSLVNQSWVGDKPCLVTVGTGAYVTMARPDIVAGWPERQRNQRFTLQTVSGEALPIQKEVFLTLTLGRRPLKIWDSIANVTNELILGLDILRAYVASVDIERQTLRLAEEEVSLLGPGARPRPSGLIVAKNQIIPAQCEEIVVARMENPLGVEYGLVEPNPQVHPHEGIYIARTLV